MNNVTRFQTNKTENKKRVAVYCRVSTDNEPQLESLENQMKAFNARIESRPDWELVNIYADEGISGTSLKRRVQFKRMLEDCKAGRIDYVLTKSVSRFARNTVDTLTTVRELQQLGIQVYFEKEKIDTANSISEMVLTIMASFAQEESRSISENLKWAVKKRYEAGQEVKVPLYGFYHTKDELFLINEEEAKIVREIFTRFVHGELLQDIMKDMIRRGVKPPAGSEWKRPQLTRMLMNEKYIGDSLLQKTYVESYLTHKLVRNKGEIPMFRVENAHAAIVDKHIFEQAQKVFSMRKTQDGNITYPYGEMLKCPHCGKTLVHGNLNRFRLDGKKIQNGGWGCYGKGGCKNYLIIQNLLDDALIAAYEEKFKEKKEQVDYYWLDDTAKKIQLGEKEVTIHWRDGEKSVVEMEASEERYFPSRYSVFYNDFLERVNEGEVQNKYKNLMGLEKRKTATVIQGSGRSISRS